MKDFIMIPCQIDALERVKDQLDYMVNKMNPSVPNSLALETIEQVLFELTCPEFDYEGDPAFNTENEEGQEGMIETFGEHFEKVRAHHLKHPKTVWTVLDNDVIVPGLRFVNRLLYFVSLKEWESENEQYCWGGHNYEYPE